MKIEIILGIIIIIAIIGVISFQQNSIKKCNELGYEEFDPDANQCFNKIIYEDGTFNYNYSKGYLYSGEKATIISCILLIIFGFFMLIISSWINSENFI